MSPNPLRRCTKVPWPPCRSLRRCKTAPMLWPCAGNIGETVDCARRVLEQAERRRRAWISGCASLCRGKRSPMGVCV